ncbi:hypothetical protein V6Z11_A01G130900 [Gossypium hirsutum]
MYTLSHSSHRPLGLITYIYTFTFITLAIRPYHIYTLSHSSHRPLGLITYIYTFTFITLPIRPYHIYTLSHLFKYTSHTTYTIMYRLGLGRIYIHHFPMNNSILRHTIISCSNTHKLTISRFRIQVWV